MNLTLGYSPCPNDCFIFDALAHHKVDTEGLDFEVLLEDVETLNRKALNGELDVTKLSFHAFGHVLDKYILLRSGSALGFNCGPLIISKYEITDPEKEIRSIAIPGKLTTANFLLSIAYPGITNKIEYVFSDIEEAVLKGKVDAGLIIHENRFTYQEKGLLKVRDLGEYWESLIHAPIPLGGIVAKRMFDPSLQQKINRVIRKSLAYAFANPGDVMPYVRAHAQEMDEEVMKKHIALYVNDFSLDLGTTGIDAVNLMFEKARERGLFDVDSRQALISL
jgi:1,4-dihydroxy-6-naphthoate synthase